MPDLDRYLYEQLRSHAAGVDMPAGDVDTVIARGRHRRHRRTSAGVLAVVAAAGTVTGVVVSDSGRGGPGRISVGSPTNVPAATGAQLSWRVTTAQAGLANVTSLSSPGSVAYAVSTAPGVVPAGGQAAEQLYRSADGLSWTAATGPTGVSAAGVAVDGSRVYTVGTGPATAATDVQGAVTTAVSWTDNGGGSWQNSVLPVALTAPAGGVTANDENVTVAAGPKGVIAVVGVNASADLSKLVPGTSAQALWMANSKGIEVLGARLSSQCGVGSVGPSGASGAAAAKLKAAGLAQRAKQLLPATGGATGKTPEGQVASVSCFAANGQVTRTVPADQAYQVVKTYPWSQVDVGSQLAQALLGEALLFYSWDGSSFQQVSLPSDTAGAFSVTATPEGFALVVSDSNATGTPVVLQSADGQTWSPVPFGLPAGATGASGIGYVAGHLVVLGQTQTDSVAFTLMTDGWRTAALPVDALSVSFGPMGVGVVGLSGGGDPGSWQVLFSRDGLQWSSASLVSLSGGAVDDANVLVGSGQAVVTVSRPPDGQLPAGPAAQVQLVGTPAS